MLKEDFLTRLQADAVKELGFFKPCIGVYRDDDVVITVNPKDHYYYEDSAPTKSQVFRWFRENFNLHSVIENDSDNYYYVIEGVNDFNFGTIDSGEKGEVYKTHEGAESACIDKLIEIAKQQKDEKES